MMSLPPDEAIVAALVLALAAFALILLVEYVR